MTNFEKIKQMTKEELTLFLVKKEMDCDCCDVDSCTIFRDCKKSISKWLDSEVKDDD